MIIYDGNNNIFIEIPLTGDCIYEEELMKSNFIRIAWNDTKKHIIPVGAYIIYNHLKYTIFESYIPTQKSENEFRYEIVFQHPMMLLQKTPFILHTKDSLGNQIQEYDWNITDNAANILAYLCLSLNKLQEIDEQKEVGWGYKIIGELKSSASCSFQSLDIISSLSEITSKFEAEYIIQWEQRTIYFGKCLSIGKSPISLKVGVNINIPSVGIQQSNYYNHFIVKGSTRNISQKNASGENVSTNTRLSLDPKKYPQSSIKLHKSGEPQLTKILIFDDVYPKLDLYCYNVQEYKRYLLNEKKERVIDHYNGATPQYKMYSIWYIRLAYPIFDTDGKTIKEWKDFKAPKGVVLDGHSLKASFEPNEWKGHSALAGREFEMFYHEDPINISKDENLTGVAISQIAGCFEIRYNREGDTDLIIPTTKERGLIPFGEDMPSLHGDKVVLFNIAMSDEYRQSAYANLEAKALEEIKRLRIDNNNYTVKSNPIAFESFMPNTYVGAPVIFDDGSGYILNSRIIKVTKKLDNENEQEIIIGNSVVKGNTQTLKEDVKSANENINILNTINNSVNAKAEAYYYALQTIIETFSSSFNDIDKKLLEKLSKNTPDTTKEVITFLKGISISNKGYGINEDGNAVFNKIQNIEFDNVAESGFALENLGKGRYKLSISDIEIWRKAIFHELEIRKRSFLGGNTVFSAAGSKITRITSVENIWRCYFFTDDGSQHTQNLWEIGDLARCDTFNLSNGNKHYWRKVVGIGKDYIDLSVSDCEIGSDIPEVEDTIVQYGNDRNADRQSLIELVASGENSPAIVLYRGINNYSLTDKRMALISPSLIEFNSRIFKVVSGYGGGLTLEEYLSQGNSINENLLKNSINFADTSHWLDNGGGISLNEEVLFRGMNTIQTHLNQGIIAHEDNYIEIQPNEIYTYSGWFYYVGEKPLVVKENMPLHFHLLDEDGNIVYGTQFIDFNSSVIRPRKWTKLVSHFRITASNAKKFRAIIYTEPNTVGTMHVGSLKFEKGAIATENIPSISEAEARARAYTDSQITASKEGIVLEASKKFRNDAEKAGVKITSNEVVIYGNKVFVRDNAGKNIALFGDNGKIKGDFLEVTTVRSISEDGKIEAITHNGKTHYYKKGTHAGVSIGVDKDGVPMLVGTNLNGEIIWKLGQGGFDKGENCKITLSDGGTTIFDLTHSWAINKVLILDVQNTGLAPMVFTDSDIYVTATGYDKKPIQMRASSTRINVGETISMAFRLSETIYKEDSMHPGVIKSAPEQRFKYTVDFRGERRLEGEVDKQGNMLIGVI